MTDSQTRSAITLELCDAFLAANDALTQRRASAIPEGVIDALVELRWLDWRGGLLQLTALGAAVLMKLQTMQTFAADQSSLTASAPLIQPSPDGSPSELPTPSAGGHLLRKAPSRA